jgi:hypothetical protein
MTEIKSNTAKIVMEEARPSCKISFICKEILVCTRYFPILCRFHASSILVCICSEDIAIRDLTNKRKFILLKLASPYIQKIQNLVSFI